MVAVAQPARRRLRRLDPAVRLWRVCRYPLLVVILSRLVVVALFAMEGWVTRPHGAGVGLPQMLRDLGAWDGIWYRSIAVHGYDPTIGHGDNAAFLPLYPMLLRGLRHLAPFVDLVWLGAAASTVLMCSVIPRSLARQASPNCLISASSLVTSAGVSGVGSEARKASRPLVSSHCNGVLSPTPRGSIPTMS